MPVAKRAAAALSAGEALAAPLQLKQYYMQVREDDGDGDVEDFVDDGGILMK